MIRSTCAFVLLLCGGLALGACGKKDDSGSTTGSAAASAATTATETATASAAPPADTASASAAPAADSGAASAAPPDASGTPAAPTGAVAQRPIDDCCAALAHQEVAARSKKNRVAAARAEEICPRVAALVRAGRATRADALNQVRSSLVGRAVPGPCR